jgi:hypothetical protein
MKESSSRNAKMAAYCQEVHELEDKFDGLELNHILRWLNEAANTLAKNGVRSRAIPDWHLCQRSVQALSLL